MVKVSHLLNGTPTENGVVTDEGRDITVGDGVTNGCVDELLLDLARDHEAIVHIGRLLKLAATDEAILAMLRACDPADAVVGVELDARAALLVGEKLQTVIVDEHVGRATLQFICGHGLLDGLDRGNDDTGQTLLVYRTLDGNMRQDVALQSGGRASRVKL
ncbi:hypothetical protein BN1708_011614 [Verticillium longisporum]|uniref:Uncharacterized protein n=1 Tax=Verticillium longisporum TaxID=100787 RepID=A0A0G4L2K3_VERLO|nr:hypothetical protein BN1708_011614 [Verticillium longisporum]